MRFVLSLLPGAFNSTLCVISNNNKSRKTALVICRYQRRKGEGERTIKVNTYASYLWHREQDCITCSAAHYAQRGQRRLKLNLCQGILTRACLCSVGGLKVIDFTYCIPCQATAIVCHLRRSCLAAPLARRGTEAAGGGCVGQPPVLAGLLRTCELLTIVSA